MNDPNSKKPSESVASIGDLAAQRRKNLELAKAQLHEAHLEDAGLFLQQSIEADLEASGELGPDEYVDLTKNADGSYTPVVKKI